MLHLLVVATVLSTCVADEVAQTSASAAPVRVQETPHHYQRENHPQNMEGFHQNIRGNPHRHLADPYRRNLDHTDNHRDEYEDRRGYTNHHEKGYDVWRDYQKIQTDIKHVDDNHDIQGPVILRTIKPHEHGHKPDIARQNKIIANVYSPDYAEPTWTIDYRYLKTGGRDYTRGPGGQILILPKGVHTNEHKEFKNYDELIDHLRERNLADRQKPQYFMPLGQEVNDNEKNNGRHYGWYN